MGRMGCKGLSVDGALNVRVGLFQCGPKSLGLYISKYTSHLMIIIITNHQLKDQKIQLIKGRSVN